MKPLHLTLAAMAACVSLFASAPCAAAEAAAPAATSKPAPAAVNKKIRYFVIAAFLAGLVEDALSLAPLGYSACAFLAAGGLALLLRADFFADKAATTSWFGALCAATATGAMALLLQLKGLVALSVGATLWRMAGSAVLAAVVVPLLFGLMRGMERALGTWEDRA